MRVSHFAQTRLPRRTKMPFNFSISRAPRKSFHTYTRTPRGEPLGPGSTRVARNRVTLDLEFKTKANSHFGAKNIAFRGSPFFFLVFFCMDSSKSVGWRSRETERRGSYSARLSSFANRYNASERLGHLEYTRSGCWVGLFFRASRQWDLSVVQSVEGDICWCLGVRRRRERWVWIERKYISRCKWVRGGVEAGFVTIIDRETWKF